MIEPGRQMLFILILMRMTGCIVFNPILGRRNMPAIARSGIILVLSVVLFTNSTEVVLEPASVIEFGILALKELMVGYVLGFTVNLFLYVIIFAGEFIDMQMGLSMAKVFDAASNTSLSISATYYNILFMLLFFVSNGHIAMLDIILKSAEIVPYGSVYMNPGLPSAIIEVFVKCSMFALSFSLPLFAAEMVSEMAVGVLMKTIPQINVFVVNIQIKILIGLAMIVMMYVPMSEYLQKLIIVLFDTLKNMLTMMG